MPDTPQGLADRLRQEGGRVIEFFNGLSQEQWQRLVYRNETNWNMHLLLAHFVSAETARKELIVNVLSGGDGAPAGFDIDAFNQREVSRLSIEKEKDLLHKFRTERNALIEVVSALSSRELTLTGNDPYLGKVPILEMIKLTYRHLQIHLRDARQYL